MSMSRPDSDKANKGGAIAPPLFFLGLSEFYVTPNKLHTLLQKEADESHNQDCNCCDSDRFGYRNRSVVRIS